MNTSWWQSAAVCLLLAGCANPINQRTAGHYYEAASAAERSGDLAKARMYFSRAYGNTKMGNLGPKAEAHMLYEYTRVTGYAGERAEADRCYQEVLSLIDANPGQVDELRAPALAEYARFLRGTGQDARAVPVFRRAIEALVPTHVEESDPIGYADLLDDFADSLRAVGDSSAAQQERDRAVTLRAAHPDEQAHFVGHRYPTPTATP